MAGPTPKTFTDAPDTDPPESDPNLKGKMQKTEVDPQPES